MSTRTSPPSAGASLQDSPWLMPFSMNRQFKNAPRLAARAEGVHYYTPEGRELLDGTAGLWCVNAGHCHPKIVAAVQQQVARLDFAPPFQFGHPAAFEFAQQLVRLTPPGLSRVFFTNSGSESVDTALKLALAYHRLRGEGQRMRLIGRERGYHGVNFGGTAVGGIAGNRKIFGALVAGVDHLRHTHDPARNAWTRGQPQHGAELADDLERLCQLHDASSIAAVIVEPVACSTGVLVPPLGYLERLRALCDRHGILLIFDEVITAWGRLGRPFGAQYFGVTPDLITSAKGITNGTVPMGAVFMKEEIYQAFMGGPEIAVEMPHGYTYSAHPLACAAGLATLQVYEEEGLFDRAAALAPYLEERAHALRGLGPLVDIRNIGLIAAFELAPRPGAPGARGLEAHIRAFERGAYIRAAGDTLAIAPPLTISRDEIDRLFDILREALGGLA